MKANWKSGLCAGLLAAGLISSGAMAAETLTGAGSTAIYPVLSIWAQKYHDSMGVAVNYQSIGSGGGIKQIEEKTVDFGASDKPLGHDEIVKNKLVQFPAVMISIVPVVHLPGITADQLVLDGPTLANIYLGKITKWNDPAIKKLNAKAPLPNMAIVVAHRSDGSGTTFNFTDYLAKVSPEWKSSIGSDTAVSWPVGIGGKGNAGVAASVAQTVGSIGYVEYAYAKQNKLVWTDMVNRSGKRVKPDPTSFKAAASNADFSKVQDYYLVLTDQPGAESWPIMGTTWVFLRTDTAQPQNQAAVKFFDWALKNGQPDAEKLDYVPIPDSVTKRIEGTWSSELHVSP
ncbi:MAG TPA: phosphate ABC transporter substrate-binding protein PstS [Rhizomicrobium sp.]|jgi:phosphate transport system substrate-binding protein